MRENEFHMFTHHTQYQLQSGTMKISDGLRKNMDIAGLGKILTSKYGENVSRIRFSRRDY